MTTASADSLRGFIVQPTYRIEQGRAVLHYFGRLEDGSTFLLRETRQRPHFYILERHKQRAARHGARHLEESSRRSMQGHKLVKVVVGVPSDAPPLRDQLQEAGVPTFEADVRFAMRHLIDHEVRGCIEIRHRAGATENTPSPIHKVDHVFVDAEIAPAAFDPELEVLAFDIETNPHEDRLLSISIYGCGAAEVLLLPHDPAQSPPNATTVANERQLLEAFVERVRELDPDVLTGWNVADYDVPFLLRRAQAQRVALELGRAPGVVRRHVEPNRRQRTRISIPGRLLLDAVHVLRSSFVTMERYSLEAVAQEVLGEGKVQSEEHGKRPKLDILLDWYENDPETFCHYNLKDSKLTIDILEKLELIDLQIQRSRLTGLPLDRVQGAIAAFDFLYLSRLGKRGFVASSVGSSGVTGVPSSGAYILQPTPGLYDNVLVLDFKSLYPSLMRTFGIDPLGYRGDAREDPSLTGHIVAPNGAAFAREAAILPGILEELFPARAEAKRQGNAPADQAIKILMNSFYGVLATSLCRFYHPHIADAITTWGRRCLHWVQENLERRGKNVLYGDTDSVFVELGEPDPGRAHELGHALCEELNHDLARWIELDWGVESLLELEFERLYLRLFLPSLRTRSQEGAMKKYAGLIESDSGPEVSLVGLEGTRKDFTQMARDAQRELFRRFFSGETIDEFLKEMSRQIRDGELNDQLIYRKQLRKRPEEYTSTTPPHVAAARKMSTRPGRTIVYVQTTAGPEPLAEQKNPLDYEHYIEKQLRAIAQPILMFEGRNFSKVIGDDRQMSLF